MSDENQPVQSAHPGRKRGSRETSQSSSGRTQTSNNSTQYQSVIEDKASHASAQPVVVIPFDFQGKAVRTVTKDGAAWFVAADVCAVLDHTDPSKAVSRLDEDERGATTVRTPGGDQSMNIVTESGLFNLVFTSRKPEAKAFRRWVTEVVLPTLRRTGKFEMESEVKDEGEGSTRNSVNVALPGAGRYLVVLFHDGDRRIEHLGFSDTVSAMAALDCRSIAYTFLTAVSFWEKLQHLRSARGETGGGVIYEQLSTAMRNGADLARQILYKFDEPILKPVAAEKGSPH